MMDKKGITFLVGMGPKPNNPAIHTFKLRLTDTIVLDILRNEHGNKDNANIQKLADMEGNDVELNIDASTMNSIEMMKMLKENPKIMLGVMIASRRTKDGEMCLMCKKAGNERDMVYGCYKVPGMEDLGCSACWCRCWGSYMTESGCKKELPQFKHTPCLRKHQN